MYRCFLLVILIISSISVSKSAGSELVISVADVGGSGLEQAVAKANGLPAIIKIASSYHIARDVLLPESIRIEITGSGGLVFENSSRLTIRGGLSAPSRRIFSGSGNVVFDRVGQEVRPEWWGAQAQCCHHAFT